MDSTTLSQIPSTNYSNQQPTMFKSYNEINLELPAASTTKKGMCEIEEDCLCFDFGFACCD
jgi:hypothetical protein